MLEKTKTLNKSFVTLFGFLGELFGSNDYRVEAGNPIWVTIPGIWLPGSRRGSYIGNYSRALVTWISFRIPAR
ncbi:hypothetical protein BLX88_16925 [Bacillus obstructivus]|nr:hypothetical protein BLX88_16925 [Bacillus obstructivus]